MLRFTMVDSTTACTLRQSVETVIAGSRRGWHNPEFAHRVMMLSDGTVRLMAQPIVIVASHGAPVVDLGPVNIGDLVMVDDVTYTITAQVGNDPKLIPLA